MVNGSKLSKLGNDDEFHIEPRGCKEECGVVEPLLLQRRLGEEIEIHVVTGPGCILVGDEQLTDTISWDTVEPLFLTPSSQLFQQLGSHFQNTSGCVGKIWTNSDSDGV
jgi:hypothetical protein